MDLLKPEEVSSKLRLSKSKIYKMAENREIESIKIGKSLRFTQQQIEEFIRRMTKNDAKNF
jgi:excisionase family DNA binding protein